jgi:hypothetical protein
MDQKFKFPTEVVELPSKGLLYPAGSKLAEGSVEMKYMTAKEEDILTNPNYLEKGIAISKLLQSLLVSDIPYDELLTGDENAILIAARILGYGKDYSFMYRGEEVTVDLTTLQHKTLDVNLFKDRKNEFNFTLPATGTEITFKLLTLADEQNIAAEIKGLRKINKEANPESVTRMKHTILSVGGDRSSGNVRNFVDNYLLAKDARALREYIFEIKPDVNTKVQVEGGPEGGVELPFGVTFLWPDAGI